MKSATTPKLQRSLVELAARVAHVPGAAAECGVYQGASFRVIARAMDQRKVYGFDTFDGLPAAAWGPGEPHKPGEFPSSLALVEEYVRDLGNAVLVPGLFPDSVTPEIAAERFAFVHLDMDFYASTRAGIEFFLPRMSPGGVIVFDDYEWRNCPGVKLAIDEFGLKVTPSVSRQVYCFVT